MKDILSYENRDQLYKLLIDDFGLVKVDEKLDLKTFGNFYITLSAQEFLLRYVNDRSFLTVEIASHSEPSKWYDLSFVRDFIYNPDKINSDDRSTDNDTRIAGLNSFIRKNIGLISDLFNSDNYTDTRRKLDNLLREQFNKRFPGMAK